MQRKKNPHRTVDRNASQCHHYGNQFGASSKNIINLPEVPAIPHMGIYLKECMSVYLLTHIY
jgi:hypothetical protein